MKISRLASLALVVAFALGMFVPSIINAQSPVPVMPRCPDGSYAYIVPQSQSAWRLLGGPAWRVGWNRLIKVNPDLADRPIDERSPDDVFVLLREGEPICGLDESGLTIGPEPIREAEVRESTGTAHAVAVDPPGFLEASGFDHTPPWWGWFALLLFLALVTVIMIGLYWRAERRKREEEKAIRHHPASLGPPMVAGGIEYFTVDTIADLMDRRFKSKVLPTRRVEGPNRVRIGGRWSFYFGDFIFRHGICSCRVVDRAFRAVYEWGDGGRFESFVMVDSGNTARTNDMLGGYWTPDPLPEPTPAPVVEAPPRPVFGLPEAREIAEIEGITERECRLHITMMRHLGADITLPKEVAQEVSLAENAVAAARAAAKEKTEEIANLLLRIEVLRQQRREDLEAAARQKGVAVELKALRDRFIPPMPAVTPPAPTVEPTSAAAVDLTSDDAVDDPGHHAVTVAPASDPAVKAEGDDPVTEVLRPMVQSGSPTGTKPS